MNTERQQQQIEKSSSSKGKSNNQIKPEQVSKETIERVKELIKKGNSFKANNIKLTIAHYKKAVQILPSAPELHFNLGNLFLSQKEYKNAGISYKNALKINPKFTAALFNLGIAQKSQGDVKSAILSFADVVRKNNKDYKAVLHLAVALNEDGAVGEAKKCLVNIASKGDDENIWLMALSNLGGIYSEEQQYEEAIIILEKALLVRKDMPALFHNLGHAYGRNGEIQKAIKNYKKALELNPNSGNSKNNLAMTYLISGDFLKGWESYNERFNVKEVKLIGDKPKCPQWNEETIESVTSILFYAEQGMGDTLQFMRFAKAFKEKGIKVSIVAQLKLHQLIKKTNLFESIYTPKQASEIEEGVWTPLLSTPKFLNVSEDNPVANKPYIQTSPQLIIKWRDILSKEKRPIIGINWQGNPKAEKTGLKGRSLALEKFAPLAKCSHVKLLSLQKGFGSDQLHTCSFKNSFIDCQDKVNETWDFMETAAIIANCDLIITSDTSVAHLAGGMGKQTWLLLKKVPDWRWGLAGERTFWYPSMKLYRQSKIGDWDTVLKEVADDLLVEFSTKENDSPNRLPPDIDYFKTQAIAQPNNASAHNNLGNILQEYRQFNSAIKSYKRAIDLHPTFASAYNNLGLSLQKAGHLNAAFDCYKTAVTLDSNYAEPHNNLGNYFKEIGQLNSAINSYKQSIRLNPKFAEAHFNLSLAQLLIGDYQDGWREYMWRDKWKQSTCHPYAIPKCPRYEGVEVPPKNSELLLVGEQGLGDTIQFMRYAFELSRREFNVSLCTQAKLHSLINHSCKGIKLLSIEEAQQTAEGSWLPLLSLPQLLNISPGNPLITDAYIHTNDKLQLKWKDLIQKEDLPIIGIHWQGNPKAERYGLKGRSFPLEALAPVVQLFEARFLSLQKGFGSEQLATCSFRENFVKCQNKADQTWDYLETAAIIANCDLIITSDTAIAHLAGGMGKPTWLLLQKIPDWRWGLERKTSFWYPSMRLFRQSKTGDWNSVVEKVVCELNSLYTKKTT